MRRRGRQLVVLGLVALGHAAVLSLMTLRGHETQPAEPPAIAVQLVLFPVVPREPRPEKAARARPRSPLPPLVPHAPPSSPAAADAAPQPAAPSDRELMSAAFADAAGHSRLKLGLPPCDADGVTRPGHKPCPAAPHGPLAGTNLDADPANSEFALEARRKADMRRYRDTLGDDYPGIGCAIFHKCRH